MAIKIIIWILMWFYALFLFLFFPYAVIMLIWEKEILYLIVWYILTIPLLLLARYYFEFTFFGLVEKKKDEKDIDGSAFLISNDTDYLFTTVTEATKEKDD